MVKDVLAILLYHAGIAAIEVADHLSPQVGESQPGLSNPDPTPKEEGGAYLGVTENETARKMREEGIPKPTVIAPPSPPKPLKGSLESRGQRLQ